MEKTLKENKSNVLMLIEVVSSFNSLSFQKENWVRLMFSMGKFKTESLNMPRKYLL